MNFKANKNSLQNIFLFALFVLVLVQVILIFKPFYAVILWSALLYTILNPAYKKIISKLKPEKKNFNFLRTLFSGLFSIGTVLIIAFLLYFLGSKLISQLISFLESTEKFFREKPDFMSNSEFAVWLKNFLQKHNYDTEWMIDFDLRSSLMSLIQRYSSQIFIWSKAVIGSTGNFLISLVFSIFILFFFYLDGAYLAQLFIKAIPINPLYTTKLIKKFTQVIVGLSSGYLLISLYQGISSFIIMKIFNVPSALLFSVVLMFASFIPMVGAAIVWAPIGIVICFTNSVWKGILFILLCGFIVSFLDNFLRPFFLKDRIQVHPLIIFFAILGGIKLFGMNGLILGPLVIIMFFTLLDILSNEELKLKTSSEETFFL
ncbi:MAG: AI-2E family transporter [Treponemataceae bacterium]